MFTGKSHDCFRRSAHVTNAEALTDTVISAVISIVYTEKTGKGNEDDEINISYKEDGSMEVEVDMPKRTSIKDSYVDLYYGWEDSTHGIYHAFLATDLGDRPDPEDMMDELAEMLGLKPDDEDFGWNFMQIKLPESLLLRVQKKAVEDYLLGRLEE